MNQNLLLCLALLISAGWAAADLPRKAPLTKYQGLWTNSPFTTKPPPDEGGPPPPNPLEDYALAGVSPIQGGYRVTIINKKKPDERKYVYSDQANASHGFKILSVERDPANVRGTVVHMMSGSTKGTVTYDEKLLTISTPAPQQPPNPGAQGKPAVHGGAAQVPNQPGVQPGANPQNPQNNQSGGVRAPRPRVIGPPPVPQAPTTGQQTTPSSPAPRPSRH